MNKFQEYPKVLKHPSHQAAEWKTRGEGKGFMGAETEQTRAERLPDVTVTNLAQEQKYAARGYRPTNLPDPVAYEAAILDAQPESGSAYQDYPRWMYHAMNIPVIVTNAAEERALGADWSRSPIEATEDDVEEVHAEARAAHELPKVDKRSKEYRAAKHA